MYRVVDNNYYNMGILRQTIIVKMSHCKTCCSWYCILQQVLGYATYCTVRRSFRNTRHSSRVFGLMDFGSPR